MNAQETIDYWIGACAAHETTIARLLEERAEARQEAQLMSEKLHKHLRETLGRNRVRDKFSWENNQRCHGESK